MSWKSIANTVGKIAPTLGSLLGGPAGASIGTLIATTLGVENSPESVSEALRINPEAAVKLAEIESNQKIKLQELQIDLAKAQLQAETVSVSDVNKTMQAEATSEHWPTYSWRPFIGFSVGFNTFMSSFIVVGAWVASLYGHGELLPLLPSVIGALMGINATNMAVLGVASWFRGKAQADPNVSISNKG